MNLMKNIAMAAIAALLIFIAIDSTLERMAKEEPVVQATTPESAEVKK